MHSIFYSVSKHDIREASLMSLVDRDTNGGIAGDNVRIIARNPHQMVNVHGLDDHEVIDIPVGTMGAHVMTQHGPVIIIIHQYTLLQKGHMIHSTVQLEAYKNKVNNCSIKIGGLQCITMSERYMPTIDIMNSLPYVNMRKFTDDRFDSLPHVGGLATPSGI